MSQDQELEMVDSSTYTKGVNMGDNSFHFEEQEFLFEDVKKISMKNNCCCVTLSNGKMLKIEADRKFSESFCEKVRETDLMNVVFQRCLKKPLVVEQEYVQPIPKAVEMLAQIGAKKVGAQVDRIFVQSVMAGCFIGFAVLLSVMTAGNIPALAADGQYIGLIKMLFGATFPVALMLIALGGGDLYTGNTLFVSMAVLLKKVKWWCVFKMLLINIVGNLLGGIIVSFFFMYCVFPKSTGDSIPQWQKTIVKLATDKMELAKWWRLLFSSIACSICITLAIFLSTRARTYLAKMASIWWVLFVVASIGFEHSISNAFILPAGIMYGAERGYLYFYNMGICLVGNLIGGTFVVGLIYFYLHQRIGPKKDLLKDIYGYLRKKFGKTKSGV